MCLFPGGVAVVICAARLGSVRPTPQATATTLQCQAWPPCGATTAVGTALPPPARRRAATTRLCPAPLPYSG